MKASESFYRNVFAAGTFIAFAAAIATGFPAFYAAALIFGALSRTAVKKGWKNPGPRPDQSEDKPSGLS